MLFLLKRWLPPSSLHLNHPIPRLHSIPLQLTSQQSVSICSFLAIRSFVQLVSGSFATYFQTAKSEVEDNEDGEDDNNDTEESNDAAAVKAPAYTAPVYNKAADPKY